MRLREPYTASTNILQYYCNILQYIAPWSEYCNICGMSEANIAILQYILYSEGTIYCYIEFSISGKQFFLEFIRTPKIFFGFSISSFLTQFPISQIRNPFSCSDSTSITNNRLWLHCSVLPSLDDITIYCNIWKQHIAI